jgi:glycine/D-amino acid oxidase-like deaminating enzyme
MNEVLRISGWACGPIDHAAALDTDIEVDVAVVGAGLTGLCSALELSQMGMRVAVVEAAVAGFGASGRNAGHLTPTIGKDLPTMCRLYRRERVRALVELAEQAIRYVESRITRHGIDCDYEPVGNVVAAVHPRQYAALERAARAAAHLGLPMKPLDEREMRARGLPRSFAHGLLEPNGGTLNPWKYVRGLRRAALDAGVSLYENTPVQRIDQNGRPVVYTERGRVRAEQVVIATNAYTRSLGLLTNRVLPIYVQLFRTAPLDARQREAVGWPGREGIYTAHEMLESYRLTRDDCIVGGAKFIRYRFGGKTMADHDAAVGSELERLFRLRFPELSDLRIDCHWGGPIAFALDFLPVVGRMRRNSNVLYAVAYAGHGLALASFAGRMIADLASGREGPGAVLWKRRVFPLPPEPLRWLTVRGLTSLLGWIDARVDRTIGDPVTSD